MRDYEVSVHTMYTSRSQFLGGSYISHEENTKSMQLEIDRLRRRLRYERQRRTPSDSDPLLLMMEMVVTGLGPGLLPVSLFRMMRTVITNGGVRVHLAKF